jgi:trans-2,3-dihydro-3-hydroxyanthranilate isomerase
MMRDYAIYDVFTGEALAGNPLAVVFDGGGLAEARMQAITREFNLSETVFVLPPANPAHTARIRIFTPGRELPFAGHPTVGAAIALAERSEDGRSVDVVSVLEENVGPVRCLVRTAPDAASLAEFDLPQTAAQLTAEFDAQRVADALCISAADIGFENHRLSLWSAGVPYVMVPVRDIGVAAAIAFNPMLWQRAAAGAGDRTLAAYVYCRGGSDHRADFHARMFAPDLGIGEDPATGSAVAAMSGAIQHFDALADGRHALMIEQGVEMGRPSHIHLHIEAEQGKIAHARIGGQAVMVASGRLHL